MARTPEDPRTEPRAGAARDEMPLRDPVDPASVHPAARTGVDTTGAPRPGGGRTLWLVLAALVVVLALFYMFSGSVGFGPAVDPGVTLPADGPDTGPVGDPAPGVSGGVVAPATVPDTPIAPEAETAPATTPPAAGN